MIFKRKQKPKRKRGDDANLQVKRAKQHIELLRNGYWLFNHPDQGFSLIKLHSEFNYDDESMTAFEFFVRDIIRITEKEWDNYTRVLPLTKVHALEREYLMLADKSFEIN